MSDLLLRNSSSPVLTIGFDDVVIFGVFGLLCLVINIGAFWAVRLRRGPPTNFSLTNFFISSVMAVVYPILKSLKDKGVILSLGSSHPWICRSWGLFLRCFWPLLPFTMMGIFFEMTNAQRLAQGGIKLKVKVFLSVWVSTLLVSLPGLDTYRIQQDKLDNSQNFTCSKAHILDSEGIQILYEGIYTSLISFLPTFYMIFALHRLKFRMTLLFLCQDIPTGLNKKVRKIRWAFFYTLFYLVFWVLPGPIIFIVRVTSKKEWKEAGRNSSNDFYGIMVRSFYSTQLALQPLFFLYAHHKFSLWDWFQKCPLVKYMVCSRAVRILRRRRKRELRNRRVSDISTVMHMETYAITSQVVPHIIVKL